MRSALFLHFADLTGEPRQLALFFFQVSFDFYDRVVCLLDLSTLALVFFFGVHDVASRALDQFCDLFGSLPIEFNAAAMRGDFTFQSLYLRARLSDLCVDFVQRAALFCEPTFVVVNPRARRALRFGHKLNFLMTIRKISFESVKLLARTMRFKHAQVRM